MAAKVLEISVPADRWSRERFARWIASRGYEADEDDIAEAGGRLVIKLGESGAGAPVETRKGGRGLEFKVAGKPADPAPGDPPAKPSIWDRPVGDLLDLEVI